MRALLSLLLSILFHVLSTPNSQLGSRKSTRWNLFIEEFLPPIVAITVRLSVVMRLRTPKIKWKVVGVMITQKRSKLLVVTTVTLFINTTRSYNTLKRSAF